MVLLDMVLILRMIWVWLHRDIFPREICLTKLFLSFMTNIQLDFKYISSPPWTCFKTTISSCCCAISKERSENNDTMIIYCYLAWTITWSRMTRFSKTRLFWKPHIQISKSLFMLYNATVLFSGQKTRSNYSQLQTGIIIFRSVLSWTNFSFKKLLYPK